MNALDPIQRTLEAALLRALGARLRSLEARPILQDGAPGEVGPQGVRGEPGPEGPPGPIGPMPQHEWSATELRFQLSPDQWGAWTDLKGPPGKDGKGGTAIVGGGSIRLFSINMPGLVPPPGVSSGRFLRDDSTWQTPSGSGGPSFGYMPQGWQ